MKQILLFTILIFAFAGTANAQTATDDCPLDKVCLTRAAAVEALRTADERDALRDEFKVAKEEMAKKDALITDLLVKFSVAEAARAILEKQSVTDNARLDFLQKRKPKCFFCLQVNK